MTDKIRSAVTLLASTVLNKRQRCAAELPKCIADVKGLGYNATPVLSQAAEAGAALPPSFFIIGAPRCGTTSLSKALARHPQISFSYPKETHFFLKSYPELAEADWRRLYIARYHPGLNASHRALGDGSVSYFYSPEALQRALRFDPDAKFIVLVRNPLEMLPSYHARLLYQLDEDIADFRAAWALQENRACGRDLPKRCRDPRLLQYGEVGRHGAHLERLFAVVGRERCLVIVFDDFIRETRAVYQRVLEFIGVADDGRTHFSRKRETMGFKYIWLQQLAMNPPPWVLRLVEVCNPPLLRRLKRVRRHVKQFNIRQAQRPALSAEMRETLRAHFAADISQLAALLGRDLSHWG